MMSALYLREYLASQKLASRAGELPANEFHSLLMAAARFASSNNLEQMERIWPDLIQELKLRYNAPGGALNDKELEYVLGLEQSGELY